MGRRVDVAVYLEGLVGLEQPLGEHDLDQVMLRVDQRVRRSPRRDDRPG